ncbi:hypothetical protein RHMOL_Rhmol06G0202900 [Rhododendron molle]|uniref:Uncharacterized protein n=1 Tax=Rhododendron molle TaxID=49168 RepID=A0ACC0NFZ2_RHOML|nr:hypothetical protein RHMOL_Rhmol06G0202900 [Rhododendron molle]
MHRLSRRSVSAILRTRGARYRNAAAASITSPVNLPNESSDTKVGWYSVLTGKTKVSLDYLKNGMFLGNRYESTAAASDASDPPAEKYEYQAEVHFLDGSADLVFIINCYFVSNASDALDKLRFLSVTEPELLKDGVDLDIRIQTDKDNGIVILTDSGIGMNRQELVDCLGTIAQSGTAKFLKALKESKGSGSDSNLIGQFGVGFYSAFLVADRVVVSTKSPKSDKQYVWEGEANSSAYTIREETDPEKLIPRGTRLTLYLKVEVEEDPADVNKDKDDDKTEKKKKTKKVVEKYWDWELTNETQPIWLRNPKDVTTEEYNEFYKKTFNEYLEPLASSHFTTEGEVEFRSILYVPSIAPMGKDDIANPKTKNIRLYVKRVFISDDFDGELVRIMRKRLVRKAFDMILGISMSENRDDYEKFWDNFGKHLKLGCIEDRENHKRLAPLLRFFSSQSEDYMISMDEYVENMKPDQKDIYYIASDSVTSAKNTPFLERLFEKDLEVLFLVDPIDEVAVQNLKSYKEKFFVDISKEDLDLGDKNEEKEKEMKQEFGQTCDWIKNRLGDKVASVQISNRLSASPCVLVSGKFGWSANMERLMKAQTVGDTSSMEFMRARRVFEINPQHPIIRTLNAACKSSPNNEEALRAIDLLYDTALISSGFTDADNLSVSLNEWQPDNPAQLGGKIYEMMGMAISDKWATPAAEYHQSFVKPNNAEPIEAEIVEPVEAGGQK